MKPRPGSLDDTGRGDRVGRRVVPHGVDENAVGDEVDMDGFDAEDSGGRPRLTGDSMDTAEVDVRRDGRVTLISTIPAQIAEEMLSGRPIEPWAKPGDGAPAAPRADGDSRPRRVDDDETQRTRRVGDSDRQSLGSGPNAFAAGEAGVASRRQRAAEFIDGARAALDRGDVTAAVNAAEAALRESDEAPAPGIIEVIEPARPLLARVFAAYVGPLSAVPVLAPRAQEIARARLGERERDLIARIDGARSLGELFDGSGVGSTDALRIAARLVRAGAIRLM